METTARSPPCSTRGWEPRGPDNLDERLELSDEVVDLAERGGDKETALRVRAFHISCLLEAGDVAAADAELQSARQRAEYLRQPRYLWHVTGLRALRALMSGRLDDGERLMEEALEFGRHADERIARHVYAIQLTTLRYSQGRLEELEGTMRAFVDQYPHLHGWRSTLALLYAELGDLPRARSEFEQLAGGGWTEVARDSGWLLTTCRAADTCFKLGDRDAAAVLYDQLRPFAGRNVVLGRVASIAIGSAARHLGQLAAVLERFDDAARHFEDAMRMNRSMGRVLARARRVRLRRGAPRPRRRRARRRARRPRAGVGARDRRDARRWLAPRRAPPR